jgi:phospholipid/cholesterol/gamma-HCH transport system substrate-binding protein
MKISNETKVGALTSIAIVFLILGFNFLKGKSLFKHGNFIYAKFTDTKGLLPSYPVSINGYQVGTVYEITAASKSVDTMIVAIKLNSDYSLPKNSLAYIKESIMTSPSIEIALGDRKNDLLKSGDTILTASDKGGLLGDLQGKIGPMSDKISVAVTSLDSLLKNFNRTLDEGTRANLQGAMANIHKISASMVLSAGALERMMAQQGSLAKSLDNMKAFTDNLNTNNEKINATIGNLQKTSGNIAEADLKGTVANLKGAIDKLNAAIDSKDGSLGLLLNDKQFYNNLVNTSRSANTLLDDIRVNPKRYVNLSFSLFGGGKKSQGDFLKKPLPQDSTGSK